MPRIPKWLPTVVVGLSLAGSGVAAAALTDGSGLELSEEPTTVPTDPATTTSTTVTSDEPTPDVPDDPAAGDTDTVGTPRYWGPECGENPTNHGGYVRRAEQNGVARSVAAHSPCGKPLSSVVTTTTVAAPETPDDPPETRDDGASDRGTPPVPPQPASPTHGRGNGHGH